MVDLQVNKQNIQNSLTFIDKNGVRPNEPESKLKMITNDFAAIYLINYKEQWNSNYLTDNYYC